MATIKDRILDCQQPHVLVMKKNSVEPFDLSENTESSINHITAMDDYENEASGLVSRSEVIKVLIEKTNEEDDLIIATTGYTGRELYAAGDRNNHFYIESSFLLQESETTITIIPLPGTSPCGLI